MKDMSKFDRKKPYNDLPLLPPKADIETKDILRKTISAGRALAQLNGTLLNLPNPTLFLDTIYLQEAKASSEVENIITTNDELYKSLVADRKVENSATKEVLSYKEALWSGLEQLKTKPFITTNLCIRIVQCIKQNNASIRVTPGTTLSNTQGEVIYTPPSGETVIREKLANLEKFINEDESIDPLIKMALMHYQFEAIHPFSDGNGRTGRVLNLLFLISENLLEAPILYLSRYIIQNKPEYYRRLLRVTTEQEWESWILYMLEATRSTAEWTSKKIIAICDLMDLIRDELRRALPKIYSYELVDVIFTQPYCRIANLVDLGIAQRQTASKILQALVAQNVLREVQVGREKIFINVELMRLLAREDDSAV
mgnify:CR=1 FL=1